MHAHHHGGQAAPGHLGMHFGRRLAPNQQPGQVPRQQRLQEVQVARRVPAAGRQHDIVAFLFQRF